jgi:small basic protein (TIGR04137 family)
MTIDKTLRVAKGLARARGVLNRAERLEKLKEQERWTEGKSIFGLPKVRVRKLALKKKKKAKAEGEEGAEGATPAAAKAPAAKGGAKK